MNTSADPVTFQVHQVAPLAGCQSARDARGTVG